MHVMDTYRFRLLLRKLKHVVGDVTDLPPLILHLPPLLRHVQQLQHTHWIFREHFLKKQVITGTLSVSYNSKSQGQMLNQVSYVCVCSRSPVVLHLYWCWVHARYVLKNQTPLSCSSPASPQSCKTHSVTHSKYSRRSPILKYWSISVPFLIFLG